MALEVKKLTPTGRFQRPPYNLIAEWVKRAWNEIDTQTIRRSFKCCGISNAPNGSEEDLIFDYDKVNVRGFGEPGNYVFDNQCESGNNDIEEDREEEGNWGEGGSNLRQENNLRFGNEERAMGVEEGFDCYYDLSEAQNFMNVWN
jgi:hypothetical protein